MRVARQLEHKHRLSTPGLSMRSPCHSVLEADVCLMMVQDQGSMVPQTMQ
jgi:hypothetical protein